MAGRSPFMKPSQVTSYFLVYTKHVEPATGRGKAREPRGRKWLAQCAVRKKLCTGITSCLMVYLGTHSSFSPLKFWCQSQHFTFFDSPRRFPAFPYMKIEALCAAPPEALTHSPSQMPLSCPVAPQAARYDAGLITSNPSAFAHSDTRRTPLRAADRAPPRPRPPHLLV